MFQHLFASKKFVVESENVRGLVFSQMVKLGSIRNKRIRFLQVIFYKIYTRLFEGTESSE
jgi:hypothetical protein